MSLTYTAIDQIPKLVQAARNAFNAGKIRSVEARKQQIRNLVRMCKENEQRFIDALRKDLHKAKFETVLTELGMLYSDADLALENLDDWVKPQFVETKFVNKFDRAQIRKDPLGVVLIIGAWNYPFQLTLVPLVGAFAAGNTVVLKPSEVSVNSAALLTELIPKYLDNDVIKIVNGGKDETTEVLRQRFDHILYTGNGKVGRIVMAAASQHLTPVTLELGGKSPVYVADDADLTNSARRIAWGRFINAGQTCLAPDYVLCSKKIQDPLVNELRKAVTEFYSSNPKASPDYARVVNNHHFKRIKSMMDAKGSGNAVIGGDSDEKENYIAPTVLANVDPESPIMQDEIFGPVLPIINVKNVEEAIDFINARDKPLGLYVFSRDDSTVNKVVNNTSSGGVSANDTLMHCTIDTLPFGGVGPSGCGAYHGKKSFDIFSHSKSMIHKGMGLEAVNAIRYPPYTESNLSWIMWLLFPSKKSPVTTFLKYAVFAALLAAAGYYVYQAGRSARYF